MRHITLEEVLANIRRRSDQIAARPGNTRKRIPANARVEQLEGMMELATLLSYADYTIPAILYGFLRHEVERIKEGQ